MKIGAFLNSERFIKELKRKMKKKFYKNGFTMTELVVTVALIGTLLSLSAPRFVNVSE